MKDRDKCDKIVNIVGVGSLRIKKVMSRKETDKKRQNVRSRGRMSKAIKEAEKILKQYYGYDHFREGQIPVIEAVLEGRDVLGIMPTGAGKSVCYQVPALMMEGITIVISPLISLMKDQVGTLNQMGVHAAFLNSSLTAGQYYKALQLAKQEDTRSYMWHQSVWRQKLSGFCTL